MGNILFKVNVTREFPPTPSPLVANIEMLKRAITDENFSDPTREQNP